LEESDINNRVSGDLKTKASISIKIISFFLMLGSFLAILFYLYILLFNIDILDEEISVIKKAFIKPVLYLVFEGILFAIIIIGCVFLLKMKKIGLYLSSISLISILLMNQIYFLSIDWINLGFTILILLILMLNAKKFK